MALLIKYEGSAYDVSTIIHYETFIHRNAQKPFHIELSWASARSRTVAFKTEAELNEFVKTIDDCHIVTEFEFERS